MTVWNFRLTEYAADKPWIVVATGRDSVELADGEDFHAWARERWPADRYRIDVEHAPFRWATDR